MPASAPKPASVLDPQLQRLARAYAQGLGDLLGDDQGDDVAAELEALVDLLAAHEEFARLLTASLLSVRKRRELIQRVFAGRVSEPAEAFIGVLSRHGRMDLLPAAVRELRSLLNRRRGRVELTVATAVPLDAETMEQVRSTLAEALGGEPVIHTRVEPQLVGGVVLTIGDQVYDASIAGRLERLRETLVDRIRRDSPIEGGEQ